MSDEPVIETAAASPALVAAGGVGAVGDAVPASPPLCHRVHAAISPFLGHVRSWIQQPTTIMGLMGTAAAAAAYVQGHTQAALVALVGSAVGLVIPDGSKRGPAERLVLDALIGIGDRNPAALPQVLKDIQALAAAPPGSIQTKEKTL